MDTIRIAERPAELSFDEIHSLLWDANEANRQKGFVLNTSLMSGAELEERIGGNGICLAAFDGQRLAGTISIKPVERDRWYARGKIAEILLVGVHPDYQGRHLSSRLMEKAEEIANQWAVQAIELDTAEGNTPAIRIYQKLGYKFVNYVHYSGTDHNSVVMVKWLKAPKFPTWYRSLRFHAKKCLVLTKTKNKR